MPSTPLLAFDMGNVLLPFDHMRACTAVAARANRSPHSVYELAFKSGLEKQFEAGTFSPYEFTMRLSHAVGTSFTEADLAPLWSDIFEDDAEMDQLIAQLALKYDLCLVSNTNTWHFAHVAERYAVISRFKHRVLSYEVKSLKPERTIYEAALSFRRAGQPTVFVDDIEVNVLAAADCGMLPIHFTGKNALIESLAELGIHAT